MSICSRDKGMAPSRQTVWSDAASTSWLSSPSCLHPPPLSIGCKMAASSSVSTYIPGLSPRIKSEPGRSDAPRKGEELSQITGTEDDRSIVPQRKFWVLVAEGRMDGKQARKISSTRKSRDSEKGMRFCAYWIGCFVYNLLSNSLNDRYVRCSLNICWMGENSMFVPSKVLPGFLNLTR